MALPIRSSLLLAVLALALGGLALAGVLPIAPQQARAADETSEETTTTPEEQPPVIEAPTEPGTTPEPEAPKPTPPVTTPPITTPTGGGGTVEAPKPTPATGTATGGGAVGGSGGGGGGSTAGGSTGSASPSGATTTTVAASPSRNPVRTPTRPAGQRRGGTGRSGGGDRDSEVRAGGGSRNTGGGGNSAGQRSPAPASGGRAPQPAISPQAIDEGASAVTNAASHVGKAFAEALPAAPLKKIGDQLAARIAGGGPAKGAGQAPEENVEQIGTALGVALIGSAVAVDQTPAKSGPLPFFDPPGGKSGTVYLLLIAALLLAVGALVFREARAALGFDKPRTGIRVADEKPRIPLRQRIGVALAGVEGATHSWFSRARRLRANAAAGLRSLF